MTEHIRKKDTIQSQIFQTVLALLAILLLALYILTFSHIHQQLGETGGIIILIPVILSAWVSEK